jgi:hypothetical protein
MQSSQTGSGYSSEGSEPEAPGSLFLKKLASGESKSGSSQSPFIKHLEKVKSLVVRMTRLQDARK